MLARSQERLARHEEAGGTIAKLVTLWKDADRDLPLLADAKAFCREIGCATP
jgi:hypothetical protein